jgi:glycosyltransferase involved in cell wall biosynthesis
LNQPLKVLQIVPSVSLVYGGPSQMVLGLSAALARQGVDILILTTNSNGDTGQPPLDVPLNCPVFQEGYQIRYFPCAPFRRYKFSLGLLQWLRVHGCEYDLAHIHALFSPVSTAAATIARWQQIPYILRPLGTLDPADLRKKRQLKQLYGQWLERPNLAKAAAVHFTSAQEARVSERFGAKTRDVVIPLGVTGLAEIGSPQAKQASSRQIRESCQIPDDRPLLLYLSRLDPKKGLELLIPALETLQAEGVVFHWILAGSNPQDPTYEQAIHHRIRTSPLQQCTTIAGFVQGDRKQTLLQGADLFVLPSYYENFGIAVAEAMAAGLPVVISDQVYIWEAIVEAQAGWVTPCNEQALTEELRLALSSAPLRIERGHNAQIYAQKHYSWDAIAQQTLRLYAERQKKTTPL